MIVKKKKRVERKWLKTQIKGFDKKHIKDVKKKIPNIEQRIKTEFGKISRYNREYKKSVKMIEESFKTIEHYTKLKDKYSDLIQKEEDRYLKMIKFMNPRVTLKSPTKSYRYWRGKVWWGVGKFKQSGWETFHIISDKKVKKLNLSKDDIRELGKEKFVDNLIKKDLLFYDNNRKIP